MTTITKCPSYGRPLFLNLALCFSIAACGSNDDSKIGTDTLPGASSAKEGAITFRVANSRYDGYGNCIVSMAEINNSGQDIRTLQISKYEAQTASGKTSKHSVLYDGMKDKESRQSDFYIKAPSCDGVTVDIVSVLCITMKLEGNINCDNEIGFVLEGDNNVTLTGSFKS